MDTTPDDGLDRIAVVGLACRVPGADDTERLWQNLLAGRESVVRLPVTGDEPEGYVPAAAPLDGPGDFDAEFFGMTPREAELTDPQHRLFLEHCWTALEHAGCDPARYDGRVGVWGGCGVNTYLVLNVLPHYRRADLLREYPAALLHGNDKDYLATRTAYRLGLTGPALSVQTACSTSLVAVAQACQSLLDYQCDMALAGGAALKLPQEWGYVYEEGGIQSPDGHCRPFDADAGGTVFGSGVGVVALKRLEDALADGDTVHAVILGAAVNNDGARRVGYAAPSVDGQAEVIAEAYRAAGISAATVGFVEAHGTGTAVGDPIELAALDEVFRAAGAAGASVYVGSVKSNLGHLNAASGVLGLIKAVLAVRTGQVPPTVHYRARNPMTAADSPFTVNSAPQPWPRRDAPRRAGVSSFGVGGTNVHVVLEEPPARTEDGTRRVRAHQIVPLSARTPEALEQARERLVAGLRDGGWGALPDVAHTLQRGRRHFAHRTAVVHTTGPGAAEALAEASGRQAADTARVAFLFPGQGSQYSGMTAGLLETEPVFATEIERCARLLRPEIGRDLRELLARPAPEDGPDPLTSTGLAQPVLFAVEYALARTVQALGVEPAGMLGHSLGEWVAATLSGVFALPDALRLVAARGRLMARMAPGDMLAVQLPEDEARALERPGLVLAAVNAPGQCVLSGTPEEVAEAAGELARRGVPTRLLETSHAFHSPSLDPMLDPFAALVAEVPRNAPRLPFVSGVTGTWITGAQATDPAYWAEQARRPVRCADGLRTLADGGRPVLLEVGPGRALGRFAAQVTGPGTAAVATVRGQRQAGPDERTLLNAVARLWEHGVEVDWAAFSAPEERLTVPLPTYPFQRRTHWIDAPGDDHPAKDTATAPGQAATSAPARDADAPREDPVLVRTRQLWSELLGVEDIAPGDDFFVLGGDSLLATRLASRIHRALGVRLPLDELFDEPSLERMAKLVTAHGGAIDHASTDHTEKR
ncbi:beta-ketoacyl synthase N-terminal-like domain-containing protein [Streptomyces sp. NPDC045369]|uniref:type I polyketide synthase n=1 Tax=Streptomyces sp. NPDC045369 TaxID=3155732 RepID=UPI0033DA29DE